MSQLSQLKGWCPKHRRELPPGEACEACLQEQPTLPGIPVGETAYDDERICPCGALNENGHTSWCKHLRAGIPVGDTPPSAPDLLAAAAGLMLERAKEYDQPGGERSVGKIVTAFNAITGKTLTEPEGWLFLQLLKQVRLFSAPGYHKDSAEDNIAYAALLAEAKGRV
jgi:hypothetical protein